MRELAAKTIVKLGNSINQLFKMEFNVNETMEWVKIKPIIFMSWGVSRRLNFSNKALCLLVNGRYFKSWVVITLDYNDTYTVSFLKKDLTVKTQIQEVYCDQLNEIIDDAIETNPNYLKELIAK